MPLGLGTVFPCLSRGGWHPRYVLIDCGVHDRYPGGRERMEAIARDIAEATNRSIQVVAVTHEHSDHLYGFMYGKRELRTLRNR